MGPALKEGDIDFERSAAQTMELQFAFQKTEWIPADDFRAKKVEQLEELRSLAKKDPVELVVHLLDSHGGTMTGDALEKELSGAVIAPEDFRKWWDSAKKALRESSRVVVPQKRNEALVLRGGERSPAQELLADFEAGPRSQGHDRRLWKRSPPTSVPSPMIRMRSASSSRISTKPPRKSSASSSVFPSSSSPPAMKSSAPPRHSNSIPAPSASRTCSRPWTRRSSPRKSARCRPTASVRSSKPIPAAFGGEWVDRVVQVFDRVGARGVTEIASILVEKKELLALGRHLRSAIARRALGPDALIWICRERNGSAIEVFSPEVGASILNLLENDHLSDGPRKTSRLQTLLTEDKQLLGDLVTLMDVNEARNFARRMLECPVFGDLEKKSLMARVIKAKPETAELVSGENEEARGRPSRLLGQSRAQEGGTR
ncbi:MAG: hypothetical protein QM755_01960 [Luteolibacter sp.]